MPATRIMLAIMLIASAGGARAECALGVSAPGVRLSCARDFAAPSLHAGHPNSEAHSNGESRRNDSWETARQLGAASVVGQGAAELESPVAHSMNKIPWVDSSDWIRNPPEWLQEIKDSRRRRAPMPVVHLWQSQQAQTLVALGVSHRGQPGLFISRKLPY